MCCLILCNVVFSSLLLKKLETKFCSLDFLRVSVREQLLIFCCWKYLFWYHVFSVFFFNGLLFLLLVVDFLLIFCPFSCCLVLWYANV